MRHFIPLESELFKKLKSGTKCFELIKDDRPYKVGDTIIYQEFSVNGKAEPEYTGKEEEFEIVDWLKNAIQGLKSGWCILGIKEKENP